MASKGTNFEWLSRSHVKMSNQDQVITKIQKMIKDGSAYLQVITDYDLTITKHHVNGQKTLSSFGLFALCKSLPEEFIRKNQDLRNHYYPIENDPHMSREEKIPHIMEWYTKSKNLYAGIKFDVRELDDAAKTSGPELRSGTEDVFRLLNQHNIPILIMSAGLGDVINTVLKKHKLNDFSNLHVIANFFELNGTTTLGYGCPENGSLLHPFNKNGLSCGAEYLKKIGNERRNLILMGDCLGDASMGEGLPNVLNILKIGFLYGTPDYIEKSLPVYLEHFDIVLVDDQTMDIFSNIINLIVGVL